MKTNLIGTGVLLLCAILVTNACGGGSSYSSYESGSGYAASAPESVYIAETARSRNESYETYVSYDEDPGLQVQEARKLIKRADLRIRVEDIEATEKPLTGLMEKYMAWSASTRINEGSRSYSIRVPSDSYDVMLGELSELGRMIRRTENTEDATIRFYDLEGRLATKMELLKTYQSYLGRANNIDEIMTVESRIADLQWEIDQTGTQFRNLVSQIDYSTINFEIVGPANTQNYAGPTFGEKLGELFGAYGDVTSTAIVVILGIIIFGVPAFLIFILLFWLLFGRIGLLKKFWRLAARKK